MLYKNFDFSQPYNLVDWLLALWTGIIFVIGKIFNQWDNFNVFQDMLVIEDGKIIFAYRVLSLLASVSGIIVLCHLCKKITTNKFLRALFTLTFLFNPVEIVSDNWIKYDPYVFLSLCILLSYSYSYFFLSQKEKMKMLYIFSIMAIAVRIEFIAFFISILLYNCYINYSSLEKKDFLKNFKKITGYILTGVLLYCIITLSPLSFIYNHFFSVSTKIGVTKSFEEIIYSRLSESFHSGTLFINITNNLIFYFKICFLALGPLVFIYILLFFIKIKRTKYLILFTILIGTVLALYGYHATHYFLTLSVIFIFGSCVYIAQLSNLRLQIISAVFNLLYISTISLGFLYTLTSSKDPRLASAEFIIQNTNSTDLLAIETHSMNGYGPTINECKDVLLQKSEVISKLGGGTGETYRLKANCTANECRKIVDIFSNDYFAGSAYEKIWINTYDKNLLAKHSPEYYITTFSFSPTTEFYDYVINNYNLVKDFECKIFDPRLSYLLESEFYFKPVRIYKKN